MKHWNHCQPPIGIIQVKFLQAQLQTGLSLGQLSVQAFLSLAFFLLYLYRQINYFMSLVEEISLQNFAYTLGKSRFLLKEMMDFVEIQRCLHYFLNVTIQLDNIFPKTMKICSLPVFLLLLIQKNIIQEKKCWINFSNMKYINENFNKSIQNMGCIDVGKFR